MEKTCIILVNYNGAAYNDKCLTSIFNSTVSDKIQVVVVDNCSSDGSRESLYKKWGIDNRVHIIDMMENSGFAKANNAGIQWARKAGISHYLLLNNDTEIAPDAVEYMWRCHEKYACIVTPKIYYADQKDVLWSAGGRFTPIIKKPVQVGMNEKDTGKYNQDRYCDCANGCALLFDEEILQKMGALDESFFLYYEDTEFSMRAGKKDIPIRYCADAVVYHKVNGSTLGNQSSANVYYITRNWLIYSRMHLGWRHYVFWLYFFINRLIWMTIWLVQGKVKMLYAVVSGIKDYFTWASGSIEYCDKWQKKG